MDQDPLSDGNGTDNFFNLIDKCFEYDELGSMNTNKVMLIQKMAECGLCFDVPIYLLNLWKSYFADTINALSQFETISNVKTNKTLSNQQDDILTCLKDIDSLFNYYLQSTISYSKRPEKFKKSHDKDHESIKFIPINLHVEKFIVKPVAKQTVAYDFTSCGAFCNVVAVDGSDQVLNSLVNTISDLSATQLSQTTTRMQVNNDNINLVVLVFNTFKYVISLSDDLMYLHENSLIIDDDLLRSKIVRIERTIEDITKGLLGNYRKYNNNDRLNYLRIKFKAFVVEVNFIFDNQRHKMDLNLLHNFLNQVCAAVVELLITTTMTSVHLLFHSIFKNRSSSNEYRSLIEFYRKNGLLVNFESLLSCFSGESHRLSDHINAIDILNIVHLHLPSSTCPDQYDPFLFDITIEMDGFHIFLYSNKNTTDQVIKIFPVLINVGINELAISSHIMGKDVLQNYTIQQTSDRLKYYYNNAQDSIDYNTRKEIEAGLQAISNIINSINRPFMEMTRPTELLNYTSDITRKLNGIRVTNCKSGKDRTGMAISLEQCRLLLKFHNLPPKCFKQYLDDFRRFGTRNVNTFKNIGRNQYAFSKIRLFLLPQLYQPPYDTIDNVET